MKWWAVWLFVWTCNHEGRPDGNISNVGGRARLQLVNVTVECGLGSNDESMIRVDETVDASEPELQFVQVYCKDDNLKIVDKGMGSVRVMPMFYHDSSTLGVLDPCVFIGPGDVHSGSPFTTLVSLHWTDYKFSTVNVTCTYDPVLNEMVGASPMSDPVDEAPEIPLEQYLTSTDPPTPPTDPPTTPSDQSTQRTDPPTTPTDTPTPPDDTPTPPDDTPTPPTDPPTPPDDTPIPPDDTPSPPNDTPIPPDDTPIPPIDPPTNPPTPPPDPPTPPNDPPTPPPDPPTPSNDPPTPPPDPPTPPNDPSNDRPEQPWVSDNVNMRSTRVGERYVAEVVPHCGASSTLEEAWIEIITDLHLSALAFCQGNVVPFLTTDRVNFYLPVKYDVAHASSRECVFKKKANSPVYNIHVEISWGERFEHVHHESHQVTCTFELHKEKKTLASSSSKRLIARQEIQSNMGSDTTSVIQLHVINVLQQPLEGPLPIGKFIKLRAESDGADGELGLRPVSCDVIGINTGEKYAILRAGCGDGIIFRQNMGFEINGRVASSPYFKSFSLSSDAQITFKCNFTVCLENCDGSSCRDGRRKRDVLSSRSSSRAATAADSNTVNLTGMESLRGHGPADGVTSMTLEGVSVTTPVPVPAQLTPTLGGPDARFSSPPPVLRRMALGLIVCVGSVTAVCLGFVGCICIHRMPFYQQAYRHISTI